MRDTTPAVEARQIEIYRRMSPAERLVAALELSMLAQALALTRLRAEHPGWSETALRTEIRRIGMLSSLRRPRQP